MTHTNLALSIALIFFCTTGNAYAYLDPGTGSIIIQGLIAAIAGGLFTIRLYWQKIKNFFSKEVDNADEERAGNIQLNTDADKTSK